MRRVHYAILLATEHTRWWLRPAQIALWWLWIAPKIPALLLSGDLGDDGNQNYPGS